MMNRTSICTCGLVPEFVVEIMATLGYFRLLLLSTFVIILTSRVVSRDANTPPAEDDSNLIYNIQRQIEDAESMNRHFFVPLRHKSACPPGYRQHLKKCRKVMN